MANHKRWYKNAWIWSGIAVIVLLFSLYSAGTANKYVTAGTEYDALTASLQKTSAELTAIEEKHSRNGLVYYSELSDSEIDNYLRLIDEAETNLDKLIQWMIANDRYLSYQGMSDLAISERINELRTIRTRMSDAQLKIASVQAARK